MPTADALRPSRGGEQRNKVRTTANTTSEQDNSLRVSLEPFFGNAVAVLSYVELVRCSAVSQIWRQLSHSAFRTMPAISLRGFPGVTGADVLLSLARVSSENLKSIDLSGCRGISARSMEDILQNMAETCAGLEEIDITACSDEAVLRAVAIRARAVCGVPSALDLYTHLKSLGGKEEEEERLSFSNLLALLHASRPLLLLEPELVPCKNRRNNALLQAVTHGSLLDVALLLTVSFALGDDDSASDKTYDLDEEKRDEGDVRTYDVHDMDLQGNSPLLLACGAGNLELAEMLVGAGADVTNEVAKKHGMDTVSSNNHQDRWRTFLGSNSPLLSAFGAGKLELAEMLVREGAKVEAEAVRMDGAGLTSLAMVSQQAELLSFALTCGPRRFAQQDAMAVCDFFKASAEAFLDPVRIEGWLRDDRASPYSLAREIGALLVSCVLESSTKKRLEGVRAFLFHHSNILFSSPRWPVKHAVQQLASQEASTIFQETYADCDKAAGESRFIALIRKREKHLCRNIHWAQSKVNALCYSPDGSKLARAEESIYGVLVCDASTGFVQKTFGGHSISNPNCTCEFDLWDGVSLITANPTCPMVGHRSLVNAVAFSPCGKWLASGSHDTTVIVWDLDNGSSQTLEGHICPVNGVAFSGDGKVMASCSGQSSFCRDNKHDNSVRLWDVETGNQIRVLEGHKELPAPPGPS